MRDEVDVGGGLKTVAALLEVAETLDVVVQLAVTDRGDGAVFVVDGLVAGCEVDDRETAHAEHRIVILVPSFAVRTAVDEAAQRLSHTLLRDRPVNANQSGNAAHRVASVSDLLGS